MRTVKILDEGSILVEDQQFPDRKGSKNHNECLTGAMRRHSVYGKSLRPLAGATFAGLAEGCLHPENESCTTQHLQETLTTDQRAMSGDFLSQNPPQPSNRLLNEIKALLTMHFGDLDILTTTAA